MNKIFQGMQSLSSNSGSLTN